MTTVQAPTVESVLSRVSGRLPACVDGAGELLTLPFLDACRQVVPVIGAGACAAFCTASLTRRAESLGTAFTPARLDVTGNIDRLAARAASTPESALLFDIVRAEVADATAMTGNSCTKALLWLKRFLEFTVRLLERLAREPAAELGVAAAAAYDATLRPFHGFLTSTLFSAIIYAAPYRSTFESALLGHASRSVSPGEAEALQSHMASFVAGFAPLLARVHVFLGEQGQDDPAVV